MVLLRSQVGETEQAIVAAKRVFAGDDELFVERTAEEAAGVRDLARVVAIACSTIATAIVALATVVVALQAIARHMARTGRGRRGPCRHRAAAAGAGDRRRAAGGGDDRVLGDRSRGSSPAPLSGRFPFGDLRRVEPNPGIRLDGPALAVGVLSVVVVLTACAWVAALHAQRRRPGSGARVVPKVIAKGPMLLATGASLAAGRRATDPARARRCPSWRWPASPRP